MPNSAHTRGSPDLQAEQVFRTPHPAGPSVVCLALAWASARECLEAPASQVIGVWRVQRLRAREARTHLPVIRERDMPPRDQPRGVPFRGRASTPCPDRSSPTQRSKTRQSSRTRMSPRASLSRRLATLPAPATDPMRSRFETGVAEEAVRPGAARLLSPLEAEV